MPTRESTAVAKRDLDGHRAAEPRAHASRAEAGGVAAEGWLSLTQTDNIDKEMRKKGRAPNDQTTTIRERSHMIDKREQIKEPSERRVEEN